MAGFHNRKSLRAVGFFNFGNGCQLRGASRWFCRKWAMRKANYFRCIESVGVIDFVGRVRGASSPSLGIGAPKLRGDSRLYTGCTTHAGFMDCWVTI